MRMPSCCNLLEQSAATGSYVQRKPPFRVDSRNLLELGTCPSEKKGVRASACASAVDGLDSNSLLLKVDNQPLVAKNILSDGRLVVKNPLK
jgi:hypothetical protein